MAQNLIKRLKPLNSFMRRGSFSIWSGSDITADDEGAKVIEQQLQSAHLILLLTSPAFTMSKACCQAMQTAVELHEQGSTRVIPIVLRKTNYLDRLPIARLLMLPTGAKPIKSWADEDDAFYDVVEQISRVINDIITTRLLAEARQLLAENKLERALALYEQILAEDTPVVAAYIGKVKVLLQQKRFQDCMAVFAEVENNNLHIDSIEFLRLKSTILTTLEQYGESLAVSDTIWQLANTQDEKLDISFYKERAHLLYTVGRVADAAQVYDQIITMEPGVAEYYKLAGDTFFLLADYERAFKLYEQAITLNPSEASYYSDKGQVLFEWGRYDEALVAYEQASSIETENALFFELKGKALFKLERYEEALEAYQTALRLAAENNPYMYAEMGATYMHLALYNEAITAYNQAIEHSRPDIDPQFYTAQAAIYRKLAEEAENSAHELASPMSPGSMPTASETFKLYNTLLEHQGPIYSIFSSFASKYVVSGSWDKTIKLWDLDAAGSAIRTLTGHNGYVTSVTASDDGELVASGSADSTIKIWERKTGTLRTTLDGPDGHAKTVFCVVLDTARQRLVSAGWDKTIKLWDLTTAQLLKTFTGHNETIRSVVMSADGQTLISAGWDTTIKIWDIATGQVRNTLEGHTAAVTSLALCADGQTLVSGSWDKTIKIWNIATTQLLKTFTGHTAAVTGVALCADRQILVSGSWDTTIKIWDIATGQVRNTLEGHTAAVTGVSLSADGQTLVSSSWDKTIKIWHTA